MTDQPLSAPHCKGERHAPRTDRTRPDRRLPRRHPVPTSTAVDSLVVTDAVPAVTEAVAERFGAEAADSPGGADRRAASTAIVIAAATDAHTELIGPASTPASRCSARSRSPGPSPRPSPSPRGVERHRRAGADRLPPPVRPGVSPPPATPSLDGELGWVHTVRSTTLDPAPPPRGVHRRLRRDLPRLQRPRLRHRALGHRPGGRRGLRHRDRDRGEPSSPSSATSPPPRPLLTFDDGATARGVQHPLQRARLRRAGSSCTAPPTASPPAGRRHPLRNLEPGVDLPGRHAVHVLHGPLRRRVPRRARRVHRGRRRATASPCTVADALEVAWIAEAATLSLREHRPVRMAEIRTSHTR